MLDVMRKTCAAGEQTTFTFQATSIAFSVKNFTGAAILVCMGSWDESQSIKISSGIREYIQANIDPGRGMTCAATAKIIVQSAETGEVEVQRCD